MISYRSLLPTHAHAPARSCSAYRARIVSRTRFLHAQVIPEIGNLRQAQEKYKEAEVAGKSLLLTLPQEHAETYVEQLIRADPMVYAEAVQEQ